MSWASRSEAVHLSEAPLSHESAPETAEPDGATTDSAPRLRHRGPTQSMSAQGVRWHRLPDPRPDIYLRPSLPRVCATDGGEGRLVSKSLSNRATRYIRCRPSPGPTVNVYSMPACPSRARPNLRGSSHRPAPTHTRTRAHTRTRTHTHTHTRTHAHAQAHTHPHTPQHANTDMRTLARACTRTHAPTHAPAREHGHTHPRAHQLTERRRI